MKYILSVASLALLASCSSDSSTTPTSAQWPAAAVVSEHAVLNVHAGVTIYNGGFGSAMATVPGKSNEVLLMTDRGPNVDGTVANNKVFPRPDFVPQIGRFRLQGDSLVLVEKILLKNSAGKNIDGLPNPQGAGGTGETALDLDGKNLGTNIDGLDPEGLVVAPDGTMWVSDEYGPHIIQYDATGRQLRKINPFGSGRDAMPRVFARRRANRGMEGLAITPDGKTLVGMMQSPLDNPGTAIRKTCWVSRIVTIDVATGASKQYAYVHEDLSTVNSEIVAITNTTFLVLERDQRYPGDAADPAVYKKIYKIDLSNATDVSDAGNSEAGKLFGGKTLEELQKAELSAQGITPVAKELVLDILAVRPDYPHDKPEGLVVLSDTKIAIVNDDDFGILPNGSGGIKSKAMPKMGNAVDYNKVYVFTLPKSLK